MKQEKISLLFWNSWQYNDYGPLGRDAMNFGRPVTMSGKTALFIFKVEEILP
jgi:hypothetical protein